MTFGSRRSLSVLIELINSISPETRDALYTYISWAVSRDSAAVVVDVAAAVGQLGISVKQQQQLKEAPKIMSPVLYPFRPPPPPAYCP